ncbi:unnamed protein product [Paramecium pentaurelia]|uniref:Uncharacterized protein n=1 Tax=Paramecium pentaurelia TaxID=43138 RepID=A0A8S1XZ93_9CILI|nr:unnamed protein product [Paramecium pentaurelia]
MSKDFIHPPCKRFGRTVFENTGFNTVRAHHSLQKDGCTRMESLKFLARKNCKIDASIILMGPKKHNILRFKPNKNLCINGWDYGEKQYETKEPNRDTLIEQIRNGDEIMKKLEDYDDKMREKNLYNFGYQDRFVQLISNQFKLPQNKEQKIQKILALKKQMRKINKQNQETLTKISQQDIEIVDSTSRMMSSTKRSNYQLPIYSENDSIIQKCDTENNLKSRETESPNLKSITDFKNKIFGNYIKRVSKQNSQPTLLSTQTSYRQHCKPLRNLLLCSGIQLGESKTNIRDKSYYTRAVFFPTESNIAKHCSLQQSQYQF